MPSVIFPPRGIHQRKASAAEIPLNCDRHHGTIRFERHYFKMDGDNLISTHLCPSCGRLMGLTRTIAAGQGYSELRTYGCRECGVWVTEGSAPRDHLKDAFIGRKRPSFR